MTTGAENRVMESPIQERGQPMAAGKRREDPNWHLQGEQALPHLGLGFLASRTVGEYNSVILSRQVWGPV